MELMSRGLQIALIVISLLVSAGLLSSALRTKMDIRSAVFWIFWCILILLLGIFPGIAAWMARLIGIRTVSNLIFFLMIGMLFCVCYYSFIKMSRMSEEIKKLTYEVSVLKKEKEEKERHG